VTIQNLDPRQRGRIHKILFFLPVHPGDRTCAFFLAAGVDASEAGVTIDPDQAINRVVGLRFRGQTANKCELFDFEKIRYVPGTERPASKDAVPLADRDIPF
jgi:hypothetical protein